MTQVFTVTQLGLSARQNRLQAAEPAPIAATACPSAMGSRLGQELLGLTLLCLGAALTLTLWLMPVGAPLALLGIGMMSAPSER